MKDDDAWKENYFSETSARRKTTVWVDNQRTRNIAENFMLKKSLLVFCCICCEILLLNVVVAHYGEEDIE